MLAMVTQIKTSNGVTSTPSQQITGVKPAPTPLVTISSPQQFHHQPISSLIAGPENSQIIKSDMSNTTGQMMPPHHSLRLLTRSSLSNTVVALPQAPLSRPAAAAVVAQSLRPLTSTTVILNRPQQHTLITASRGWQQQSSLRNVRHPNAIVRPTTRLLESSEPTVSYAPAAVNIRRMTVTPTTTTIQQDYVMMTPIQPQQRVLNTLLPQQPIPARGLIQAAAAVATPSINDTVNNNSVRNVAPNNCESLINLPRIQVANSSTLSEPSSDSIQTPQFVFAATQYPLVIPSRQHLSRADEMMKKLNLPVTEAFAQKPRVPDQVPRLIGPGRKSFVTRERIKSRLPHMLYSHLHDHNYASGSPLVSDDPLPPMPSPPPPPLILPSCTKSVASSVLDSKIENISPKLITTPAGRSAGMLQLLSPTAAASAGLFSAPPVSPPTIPLSLVVDRTTPTSPPPSVDGNSATSKTIPKNDIFMEKTKINDDARTSTMPERLPPKKLQLQLMQRHLQHSVTADFLDPQTLRQPLPVDEPLKENWMEEAGVGPMGPCQEENNNDTEDDACRLSVPEDDNLDQQPTIAEQTKAGDDDDAVIKATASDDTITRCICNYSHDDGYMISCDKCEVWQHVVCMGLDRADIPDVYMCELCQPRFVDRRRARHLQTKRRLQIQAISSSSEEDNDKLDNSTAVKSVRTRRRPKAKKPPMTRRRRRGSSNKRRKSSTETKAIKTGSAKLENCDLEHSLASNNEVDDSNLNPFLDQYEEAVTNHYSQELRARLSSMSGIRSSELRSNAVGGPTRSCVSLKGNGIKILTASTNVAVNTPIIECKGKMMLSSQYSPKISPDNPSHRLESTKFSPNKSPCEFVIFHSVNDNLEVCLDCKTYGNDARFCRRSGTNYNSVLRHTIEKGSLHIFIVVIRAVEKNREIILPSSVDRRRLDDSETLRSISQELRMINAGTHRSSDEQPSSSDDQKRYGDITNNSRPKRRNPKLIKSNRRDAVRKKKSVREGQRTFVETNPTSTPIISKGSLLGLPDNSGLIIGVNTINYDASIRNKIQSREDKKMEQIMKAFEAMEKKSRKKDDRHVNEEEDEVSLVVAKRRRRSNSSFNRRNSAVTHETPIENANNKDLTATVPIVRSKRRRKSKSSSGRNKRALQLRNKLRLRKNIETNHNIDDFPKTKKMMATPDSPPLIPPPPCVAADDDVSSTYLRSPCEVGGIAPHLLRSSNGKLSPSPTRNVFSAKKRWLKQAISEEEEEGGGSPVTPLKKRRLASYREDGEISTTDHDDDYEGKDDTNLHCTEEHSLTTQQSPVCEPKNAGSNVVRAPQQSSVFKSYFRSTESLEQLEAKLEESRLLREAEVLRVAKQVKEGDDNLLSLLKSGLNGDSVRLSTEVENRSLLPKEKRRVSLADYKRRRKYLQDDEPDQQSPSPQRKCVSGTTASSYGNEDKLSLFEGQDAKTKFDDVVSPPSFFETSKLFSSSNNDTRWEQQHPSLKTLPLFEKLDASVGNQLAVDNIDRSNSISSPNKVSSSFSSSQRSKVLEIEPRREDLMERLKKEFGLVVSEEEEANDDDIEHDDTSSDGSPPPPPPGSPPKHLCQPYMAYRPSGDIVIRPLHSNTVFHDSRSVNSASDVPINNRQAR